MINGNPTMQDFAASHVDGERVWRHSLGHLFLAWLVSLAAVTTSAAEAPLARSPLEITTTVTSVQGSTAHLRAETPGAPVSSGMEFTLLRDGEAVGRLTIERVERVQVDARITEPTDRTDDVIGMTAVAPWPIAVTQAVNGTAHVALPAGHSLPNGTVLIVYRQYASVGEACLDLTGDSPHVVPYGDKTIVLKAGDVCYATFETKILDQAPPQPAGDASAEALVIGADGTSVYFHHDSPDAFARMAERLTITRNDQEIAVVRLFDDGPLRGRIESTNANAIPRAGDVARLWRPVDDPALAASDVEPAVVAPTPPSVALTAESPPRIAQVPDVEPAVAVSGTSVGRMTSNMRLAPPKGTSFSGPTGIIRVPNAETQPAGTVRIGRVHADGQIDRTVPGNRSRAQITAGIVPGFEVGWNLFGRNQEDQTYNAKIRLIREGDRTPAVAVGTMDERATLDLEPTRYVALGKHFGDGRIRATVGFGDGGIDGVFGGVEAAITRDLSLLAEYGAHETSFGLRGTPTPEIQIDLAELGGEWGGQINYALMLDEKDPAALPVVLTRPEGPIDDQSLAERLQGVVCDLGMENVRTQIGDTPTGRTAVVFFENRRFLHDETEAIGRVLAVAAGELPPDVTRLAVVVLKSAVPVLRLIVHPTDYARFLSGELPARRFSALLTIDHSGRSPIGPRAVTASTQTRYSTQWTTDIELTPVLWSVVGTEDPTPADPTGTQSFDGRIALRPDVTTVLGTGLQLHLSHGIHVTGSLGPANDIFFDSDAANVSYTFRGGTDLLGRVAAGDFLGGRRGAMAEGVVTLADDRLMLRGVGGRLSDHRFFAAGPYRWTYLGDVRYRIPTLDATLSTTFGRYIDDDRGFTLNLRKYFGDVEVNLGVRDTDYGRTAVVSGAIPIGSSRRSRPSPVRVRVADRFHQSQGALAEDPDTSGLLSLTSSIGRQVREFDLPDEILNRDRLNEAYIRAHLSTLIEAARAVVGARALD